MFLLKYPNGCTIQRYQMYMLPEVQEKCHKKHRKETFSFVNVETERKKEKVLKELKKGLHFGTYQEPGDLEAHLLW